MNLREAAQQALEAMNLAASSHDVMLLSDPPQAAWKARGVSWKLSEAISALRAALAEPEQEPVAWMVYTLDGKSVCVTDNPNDFGPEHKALPLYTAPTPRKPLHDMAVFDLADEHLYQGGKNYGILAFARAIEAAHGIGEQT